MGITIDQQRQRVEHEITRMVDDLDRSNMRNLQVLYSVYCYLPFHHKFRDVDLLLEKLN